MLITKGAPEPVAARAATVEVNGTAEPIAAWSARFDALLADNTQAWDLGDDGAWVRAKPPKGEQPRTAQIELMARARSRARR